MSLSMDTAPDAGATSAPAPVSPDSPDSPDSPNSPNSPDSPATESAPPRRRRGLRAGPLRVRNFRLLMGGQLVSTVGDMFYAVALPWFVLSNGGSPRDLGIVLAAYGIPRAGSVLLGGMLSDRVQPRLMMLVADIARALLVGGLAAIVLLNLHTLWILCAIAAPLGLFEGIFLPASMAILPSILEDDDLQAGNAINMATVQVATLAGPGVGGVIVASVRSGVAFVIDAITFVVSALALAGMRGKRAASADVAAAIVASPEASAEVSETTTAEGVARDAQEPKTFWALLRVSRLLQVGLTVSIVANLAFGGLIEVALPDLAHGPLHAGATGFGMMISAFGAGALTASSITGSAVAVGLSVGLAVAVAARLPRIPASASAETTKVAASMAKATPERTEATIAPPTLGPASVAIWTVAMLMALPA